MGENIDLTKNPVLQEALKEFEVKNAEQEVVSQPAASQKAEAPKMIIWVMAHSGGLIKDERQAEYALLGFTAIAIIASLFIFLKSGPSTEPPPLTPLIEQAGSPADLLP